MIKLNRLKFIFIFILLLPLNTCVDTRVTWKAIDMGCVVPSANLAFVEISQIQSTGTTRDFAGIAKYAKYVFKKPIIDVEDRCKHTKVVIDPSLDIEKSTNVFNSSLLDALQENANAFSCPTDSLIFSIAF